MTGFGYTGEENLRRIKMDSQLKYIVLEGEDDILYFSNNIQRYLNNFEIDKKSYEIIFSEGKDKTIAFVKNNPEISNAIFLIDRDFDQPNDFSDYANVLCLDKYNIENYLFSVDFLIDFSCRLLAAPESSVKDLLQIEQFFNFLSRELQPLLLALFYYQKKIQTDRSAWRKIEIRIEDDEIFIGRYNVNNYINQLYEGHGMDSSSIDFMDFWKRNYYKDPVVFNDLPGDFFAAPFHFYLKQKISTVRRKAYSSVINCEGALMAFLSDYLFESPEFKLILAGIGVFFGCQSK